MSRLGIIFFVDMRLIAALIVAMFFFLRELHAEECPLLKCVPCSNPNYGYVVDKATGCRTCTCKRTPCADELHPHNPDIYCGRGPTHKPCPDGSECLIAPNDAYAVCCPTRRRCRAG